MALIGAAAIAGCYGFDLEPYATRDPDAMLMIDVQQHVASTDYRIRLNLDAGLDQAGEPRDIGFPMLFIESDTALPRKEPNGGQMLLYEWARSRDTSAAQFDTVHVVLPDIGTQSPFPATLPVAVVRRLGSSVVSVVNDELRLDIVPVTVDTAAVVSTFTQWQLQLRKACNDDPDPPALIMQGFGPVPSELIAARATFAALAGSARACLTTTTTQELKRVPYRTVVLSEARVEWEVRIP